MKEISIYVMGKEYKVPEGQTIMKALEYAGFFYIRGAGCRGGFCGSCGTVYRTKDSYRLKVGLACQNTVEEGMYLTQIPFYPANKKTYFIKNLSATAETLITIYPEILRCISCGSCTKVCPQEIDVMDFVNAAIRGDIKRCAELSFNCILCGLCASRCPAEIVQYYVALLARRLYGAHILKNSPHLKERLKEMDEKKFESDLQRLLKMDTAQLKELYQKRDIEE